MKVVFFGSSRHSAEFLEQATKNGLKIDLVVSRPPKPIGRKQILTENPTITMAKKLNLHFIASLNEITRYRDNEPTLGLILDYNKIIPLEIINLFPKGIINVHFSKLPQYRGPAPVQTAILNGDTQTAITFFLITENIDDGPILKQTPVAIKPDDTSESLYQKMIATATEEIVLVVANRLSDKDHPCQQQGNPTFTAKLTTENCLIDWTKSSEEIERLICAAYPEPGAWTSVQISPKSAKIKKLLRLKILSAHLEQGKLTIDQVQLEGKNPVSWKQFQQGYPDVNLTFKI